MAIGVNPLATEETALGTKPLFTVVRCLVSRLRKFWMLHTGHS